MAALPETHHVTNRLRRVGRAELNRRNGAALQFGG
jgi:hypothetical protein